MPDPISDKLLISCLEDNKGLFNDLVIYDTNFENIVISGNVTVLKYYMKLFPRSKPQKYINHSIEQGNLDMVKYLFDLTPINLPDYNTITESLKNGHFQVVNWILTSKKDIDIEWMNRVKEYLVNNMDNIKKVPKYQLEEIQKIIKQ